jgi:hypothetical protein
MISTCSATISFTPDTDVVMRDMVGHLKRSSDAVLCGIVYDEFLTEAIATDRLFDITKDGAMSLTPYAELVALEISHLAHSTQQDTPSASTRQRVLEVVHLGGFGVR